MLSKHGGLEWMHVDMELVSRVTDLYLKDAEGSEAARLRFLEGLWEIQSLIEAKQLEYLPLEQDAARDALISGQSLFMAKAPSIAVDEYLDAVARIAHYVGEMAGLPAEQVEALEKVDFAESVTEERLSAAVGSPEGFVSQVAEDLGAKQEGPLTSATIGFVLFSALVPFLSGPAARALEALGEFDWSAWGAGHCPVCGAAASLGKVGEKTQLQGADRALWCGVCHAEWSYERIRCVRCGCRSQDKLRYSYVESDPAHRVHLCDECHGYAKFVFIDDLHKPLSMVVEDAVSTPLDAIALDKGYTATGDGGSGAC